VLTEALNSYTEGKDCLLYTVSTNTLHAQIFCLKSGPWQAPDIRVSLFTPYVTEVVYGELISNSKRKNINFSDKYRVKKWGTNECVFECPEFCTRVVVWQ